MYLGSLISVILIGAYTYVHILNLTLVTLNSGFVKLRFYLYLTLVALYKGVPKDLSLSPFVQ